MIQDACRSESESVLFSPVSRNALSPSIVNSFLMKETRSFYIRYHASSLHYSKTK
ncbi:hypothetical protein PAXINDRAFT_138225 [Paxillus involutus ATCC 200175]|uniref:Unplaced genomic scaffold PAXINscaffold_73, whole genome shotgun sequence n=1 Tax=Paxillus involutus ATCC 200175 TaxID=664439 RepID=A0A0C9TU89_PAXIN|nr:hypothetical protein PAXINDRAFT_138225 [Paxillus involutus ATCC 200175]